MPIQTELIPAIDEKFQIKVYGKKVIDVDINTKRPTVLSRESGTKLVLVKVYGTKIIGDCIKLTTPLYTLLPDIGIKPDGCGDLGNPDDYLMWTLGKSQEFVSISFETGTVGEILNNKVQPRLDVNADFHVHDLVISGTSISGKLRAYLHLHQKLPWPLPAIDITVVDGDFPFSVNVDTCVTVATVAVVSAQVCFHTKPNRICGEVSVGIDLPVIGHWGQNFPIACVNV